METKTEVVIHELGGHKFVEVGDSTAAQDLYFMGLVSKAGLDELTMHEAEEPEHFARRVLQATIESGKTLEILGALLIPAERVQDFEHPGDYWTPETAAETAQLIGRLKGRDKPKLHSLILSLLISFFEFGIVSLWTTQKSSSGPIPLAQQQSRPEGLDAGPSSSSHLQMGAGHSREVSPTGPCESPSNPT